MSDSRFPVIPIAIVVGIVLAGVFYSLLTTFEAADSEYTVVDLGALEEGTRTRVYGFNSHDGLTGEIQTREGKTRAFVWDPQEGLTILGTLGGNASYGRAINDSGQAVGFSDLEGSGARAYLWTREEGMRDLGVLGGARSEANSNTWDGRVLGISTINPTGEAHAFLWSVEEGMRDLGTLGGKRSEVFAANASGTLVGWSLPADRMAGRAAVWTTTGAIQDLGTLGGEAATAYGIDSKGRVVGKAEKSKNVYRAFLWSATVGMVDLGTLGGTWSVAYSLSEKGEVFGLSSIGGSGGAGWMGEVGRWLTGDSGVGGDSHAVVWREGKPFDLNGSIPPDSGWELIEAFAINTQGNILARGICNGEARSCYLIPRGAVNPFSGHIARFHDES